MTRIINTFLLLSALTTLACQEPNQALSTTSVAKVAAVPAKASIIGTSGDVFQDYAVAYCDCMSPVFEKMIEVNRCQKAGFVDALRKAEQEQQLLLQKAEPCRRALERRYASFKPLDDKISLRRALVQACPKMVMAGL